MADQPHDPVGHPRGEERGALELVGPVEPLADVVEQGGGPELGVGRATTGVLVDLQGVEEGVSFRMPAGVLRDPVDAVEETGELLEGGFGGCGQAYTATGSKRVPEAVPPV